MKPVASTSEIPASELRQQCVQHLDALYATALRLTSNPGDAKDLVQDAYVKALRFEDKFRAGTNLKAWMNRILVNTFINKYRRKTRERNAAEEFADEPIYENFYSRQEQRRTADPESAMFGRLVRDDILRALNEMPDDFRTAVILADVEEMSYKEIAGAMSCPVGTVMSRLYRGRRLLQEKLAAQAADAGVAGAEKHEQPVDLSAYRRRRAGGED